MPDGERRFIVAEPAIRVITHTWATSVGVRDVNGGVDDEEEEAGSGTCGKKIRSRVDS